MLFFLSFVSHSSPAHRSARGCWIISCLTASSPTPTLSSSLNAVLLFGMVKYSEIPNFLIVSSSFSSPSTYIIVFIFHILSVSARKITKKNPYTQVYGHKNAFFLYFVAKISYLYICLLQEFSYFFSSIQFFCHCIHIPLICHLQWYFLYPLYYLLCSLNPR